MDEGAVLALIDRLVSEGTVVARSDGSSHGVFPVATSVAEGEALGGWVMREDAQNTIEVGLGYAVSTLCICDGLLRSGASRPLVGGRSHLLDVGHATVRLLRRVLIGGGPGFRPRSGRQRPAR
jgi:hypothetical protein